MYFSFFCSHPLSSRWEKCCPWESRAGQHFFVRSDITLKPSGFIVDHIKVVNFFKITTVLSVTQTLYKKITTCRFKKRTSATVWSYHHFFRSTASISLDKPHRVLEFFQTESFFLLQTISVDTALLLLLLLPFRQLSMTWSSRQLSMTWSVAWKEAKEGGGKIWHFVFYYPSFHIFIQVSYQFFSS